MTDRKLIADETEKHDAGKILYGIFFTGNNDEEWAHWLHEYLARRAPGVEEILAAEYEKDSRELPDDLIPRTLIDMFGSEIFEGEMGAEMRDKILDRLFENERYRDIFKIFLGTSNENENVIMQKQIGFKKDKRGEAQKYLSCLKNHRKHSWIPGKRYARSFTKCLRLPDIFAGIPSDPKPGRIEEAVPKADLKPLKNFQINMKKQIIAILAGDNDTKRAIVTLPTGAGKTRIVVEAVVDFLNKSGTDKNILWIAQSQEVCEQAVLCFKQIWEHHGKGEILNIFRAWGDNDLPTSGEHGVIVGGYKKLVSRKNELDNLIIDDALAAVFIDEAHHSIASSYREILSSLRMSTEQAGGFPNDDIIPLIGLTATPERRLSDETRKLRRMYGHKMIYPSQEFQPNHDTGKIFDNKWNDLGFMRRELIDLKYLAEPEFHSINPGYKIHKLTEKETEQMEGGNDRWMMRIATEEERNKNIKDEILKWAKTGKKILYFGTNVSQSNAMARILEKEKIHSACITGDTRYATRKLFVDIFNERNSNKIQVMCNYNVLATGFDSPQIDVVIIARPTTSVVSYQQMIGRGLRGEKFGGKIGNRCDIVTVKDNITKFDNQHVDLGYRKFEEMNKKYDNGGSTTHWNM